MVAAAFLLCNRPASAAMEWLVRSVTAHTLRTVSSDMTMQVQHNNAALLWVGSNLEATSVL